MSNIKKWRVLASLLIIMVMLIVFIPTHVLAAANHWITFGGTGTGNWSNVNHWSLGHAPDATEDAIFDAASFNGAGQVVTVDVAASCLNMNWTGATNNPTLAFSAGGYNVIAGSLTTIAAMTWNSSAVFFDGAGTITTNGLVLNTGADAVYTPIGGGTYTFQDNFTCVYAFVIRGGVTNTNGKTISCGAFETATANPKTLTLGSSVINCTSWDMETGGGTVTLTANTSTINCSGNFTGGGLATYNVVNLTGATSTITGSNTSNTLALSSGTTQAITFTDGTTQTATTFTLGGSLGHVHTLQGSSTAGWALSKTSGIVSADFISISRSTAGGGATFSAVGSSVNGGNNVGWVFPFTITTGSISNVTGISATASATLTDMGGAAVTERGIVWGYNTAPTTSNGKVIVSGTIGSYSGSITGLIPTHLYYVRAYGINSVGTHYGNEITFTSNYTQSASSNIVYLLVPLLFVALMIVAMLFQVQSEGFTPVSIVILAVIIFLGIGLLMGLNTSINLLP